jgi:hypothetical protein
MKATTFPFFQYLLLFNDDIMDIQLHEREQKAFWQAAYQKSYFHGLQHTLLHLASHISVFFGEQKRLS